MPSTHSPTLADRYAGALLGLACGDALGTTVEFSPRGSFAPLTDIVGGGPFDLEAGMWTDDTSMAMCLAESLVECDGFDAHDQMSRYLRWYDDGYWSPRPFCFDIGMTTAAALDRYRQTGDAFAGSERADTAGNGSLMRLAPVALMYHPHVEAVVHHAAESSRTTHGAPEAVDACRLLGFALSQLLGGSDKLQLLRGAEAFLHTDAMRRIATGAYVHKRRDDIQSSGYAVASVEAALWCFDRATSFEDAVLEAANLGHDADTVAAITGQLAGAHYGASAIPESWRKRLFRGDDIEALSEGLLASAMRRGA